MPEKEKRYPALVAWSEEDGGFVARVPFLRGLSAFGETQEEALHELDVALEAYLETARENDVAILPPAVTLDDLSEIVKLLNLSELSRRSGLSVQTLTSKLKRGTALTEDEAASITRSLEEAGLVVLR